MATKRRILKKWFSNFKKPPQEQFWAWMDAYWHKDDKIPMGSIENLDNVLGDFPTKTEVENLTKNITNLQTQINNLPKPSEYELTEIKGDKFQFIKDGKVIQEIDLTTYVNADELPRIISGKITDAGLVLTRDDSTEIVIPLADLKIEPPKKGIQFLAEINLMANTPTKFELPTDAYFFGVEVVGTTIVSFGTSEQIIDDLGEIDSDETPILEIGLTKVSEVWFQAGNNTVIIPIVYFK